MIFNIEAVAFDIDGTMYSDRHLFIHIAPYFFKNIRFFYNFGKTRARLHGAEPVEDFFEHQARLAADFMKMPPEKARMLIQEKIYDGLKGFFPKIRPFKDLNTALTAFKDAGLKLGLLSDFPPEQKGDLWGVRHLFDYALGSESCGVLKPHPRPFEILEQGLGVPAERILYIGNSIRSDVKGAHAAGMKTAYLTPLWRRILHKKPHEADICFKNYRQLCKIVLQ